MNGPGSTFKKTEPKSRKAQKKENKIKSQRKKGKRVATKTHRKTAILSWLIKIYITPPHITTLTQAAQYIPQQYPASTLTQLAQYHPSIVRHYEYNADGPLKNMIESSVHINTATLMPYLKPASNAEKCLIIRCLYTCWYHKDSDFIKRFNKAWEGRNARKKYRSQKKSKVSSENRVPEDNNVPVSQIATQPCVELPHEKTPTEAMGALNEKSSPLPADENMDDKYDGNHPFMWLPY